MQEFQETSEELTIKRQRRITKSTDSSIEIVDIRNERSNNNRRSLNSMINIVYGRNDHSFTIVTLKTEKTKKNNQMKKANFWRDVMWCEVVFGCRFAFSSFALIDPVFYVTVNRIFGLISSAASFPYRGWPRQH